MKNYERWIESTPAVRLPYGVKSECVSIRLTPEDRARLYDLQDKLSVDGSGYGISRGLLIRRMLQMYHWHVQTHLENEQETLKRIGQNLKRTTKKPAKVEEGQPALHAGDF